MPSFVIAIIIYLVKRVLIQACRGVRLDHGKSVRLRTGPFDAVDGPSPITDGPSKEHSVKEVTIPTEADFLIANSTVPGELLTFVLTMLPKRRVLNET